MKNIESNPSRYRKNQARRSWETVEYTENSELPYLEHIEIVEDFLPPPEMLVKRESETEKVTIVLDKETVDSQS